MDDLVNKAAGVAGLAGSAVMFSPLGMPFVFHGVSGMVVGGLGLYAAGKVVGAFAEQAGQQQPEPSSDTAYESPKPESDTDASSA
ncbi:MAG: hypothetical protein UMU76_10205 [Prosthecochloris sp.]|nr:hypothetical protein [Prosthecochloris sp.]